MRDARELADYILLKAAKEGRFLTPLHVNKMCYLVQGFTLRATGECAFHNDIEAWPYGPVVRDVYEAFRTYGRRPIRRLHGTGEPVCVGSAQEPGTITVLREALGSDVVGIADEVVDGYASIDGGTLIGMTHEDGTPWSEMRRRLKTVTIPTSVIQEFYAKIGPDTVGR